MIQRPVRFHHFFTLALFTVLALAGVFQPLALAQESILTSFTGNTGACQGEQPKYGSLIQASDGNFYAATQNGGANGAGAVVQVTPAGGCTVIHSFSSAVTDGAYPYAGVVQGTDGNLYGTTYEGGANNDGTVYKVSITSPYTFTLMHSFAPIATDGAVPYGALVQGTDGNFYGTTVAGGASRGDPSTAGGTVFKISPTAPYPVTLMHSFSGGSNNANDGAAPYGGLVQGADGNFYGTTTEGGTFMPGTGNAAGTVFQISPVSPYALTLIHSFVASDGKTPYDAVVQGADGYFYGTTINGGANGTGAVFKVSPTASYTFTLMYSFMPYGYGLGGTYMDGEWPTGSLVLGTDGKFYGTTTQSGYLEYLDGTLFSVGATSPYTYTQLHIFTYGSTADGAQPNGGLVQGADGNFYGTTYYGGTGGISAGGYDGTVFKYVPATALAGPVALTVPASVVAGAMYTLGYSVFNAYSATLKQCVAANTAGDTTWTGIVTAAATNTNVTLTAPTTVGSYSYSLTCGGMEYGFTTLTVIPAPTTPSATLNPTSIAFGNETVAVPTAATTVTLSNPGTATLNISGVTLTGAGAANFAITNNTCGTTLAVTKSCTLGVTFTPATAISYNAAVSFADNAAASPQTVALSGTGVAAAPVVTLTTPVAFGNQSEGTTSALKALTLSNTGNATLNITSITIGGTNPTNFVKDPSTTCGTALAATSTCTIYVSFSPTTTTTYSATLSVADNATGSPHTAALSGTGTYVTPTVTLLPNPVAFGNIVQGSKSGVQTVTLINTGTSPYNITGYGVSDATDYSYTTTCGSVLQPTGTCIFNVTFQPASVATLNATLNVNDTTDSVNITTNLTGVGTATPVPLASLTTPTNFGNQTINTPSNAETVTLSNAGNAALTITSITIGGTNASYFATSSGTCGTTLPATSTCTILVTFTPAAIGAATATLSVADNAAGSPQIVPLAGTGIPAVATDFTLVSPTPPQAIQPGMVATFTINTAALSGSFNTPIVLSVTGLPSGATASFLPASVTPGSGVGLSVLSILTPSLTASNAASPHSPEMPWLATLLLLPLWALRRRFARLRVLSCALLMAALLPILLLGGCGGGYFGPQAQTYTLNVTGTSGSTQHSTTVTLTVK